MVAVVALRAVAIAAVCIGLLGACAPWQPAERPGESPARPRVIDPAPLFHEVARGDTLYSIAFRYGLDWRRVARWNGIDAPYIIRPGQELRLSAPPRRAVPAAGPAPAPAPAPGRPQEVDGTVEAPATPAPAASNPPLPADSHRSERPRSVAGLAWQWPTRGRVSRPFDAAATRKGIGIAGTAGQPVWAAADGRVVYSGTALIGYGELIIIKHSDELLSAYGHNRRRLVNEGDRIERGQQIAEMGTDDRREDVLHFEIRRNGEPVNPLDYLPKR
ncbi:MAG: peptidoglycan DD-metalloendopeptidase family protein [Pseudomonadota bacterium]|nr:MAG: peptidoglycan DD-metalloendopeptidase family protein [Pseudomonadota bacterium]